jgi:hypothetical protein
MSKWTRLLRELKGSPAIRLDYVSRPKWMLSMADFRDFLTFMVKARVA